MSLTSCLVVLTILSPIKVGNAIEIAIVGQAKRFIKSAASQKVIGMFIQIVYKLWRLT